MSGDLSKFRNGRGRSDQVFVDEPLSRFAALLDSQIR
jgi:hypothetical protein